jgi:hypothetical protein
MRQLSFLIGILLVLVAGSFASIVAASASDTPVPIPRGSHAGFGSPLFKGPSSRLRSAPSISTAAPAVACDGQFHYLSSPNGTGNNYLSGIAAVSANDVWAVGNSTKSSDANNFDQTLAEHWNGTSWTKVPTVNPGPRNNDLFSVSAVSSNDVWAVGAYQSDSINQTAAIAEHWNGVSWTQFPTYKLPPGSNGSLFFGVTAISSNDVWAVGGYWTLSNYSFLTLIEHYNGTKWDWIVSPNAGTQAYYNQLVSVSALNADDVWAVGTSENSFTGAPFQPFAVHWDGVGWTQQSTAPALGGSNEMLGVTALEPGHAVAVGYGGQVDGVSAPQGAVWDLVAGGASTPGVLTGNDSALNAVAISGDSVWAVGYLGNGSVVWPGTFDSSTHILTWSASPGASDNASADNNVFFGVTAISPNVFWAAGYWTSLNVAHTFTEVLCDLKLDIAGPATAAAGKPFSVTVTAKNPNLTTTTSYRGTVHFTSSDSQAVLPADYTFTPGDAGVHTFNGVVLKDPFNQPSTITVSDVATPFVSASAAISVSCLGACQSPAGTPGGRGANPTVAGTPGSRGVNQSPAGTQAPRLPSRTANSSSGSRLPSTRPAAAPSSAAPRKGAASALPVRAGAHAVTLNPATIASGAAPINTMELAARHAPLSPEPDRTPWYLLLLLPLLVTGLVIHLRYARLGS